MNPQTGQRTIDRYVEEYDLIDKRTPYRVVLYMSIVLTLFGLVALIWALPFPHLAFLGKYNGYLNWASFLIAGLIYYLLRLSPVISYVMLFVMFSFSYIIIQIEGWQKSGGPQLWLISAVALIMGLTIQLLFYSETKLSKRMKLLIKAPLWMLTAIMKRFKLNY
ncbi:hypothetical protein ABDD95_03935 [Mucilaginibacter sp. PAMB04274]|uniref:hypothetical protein n=1 Tax=Mucilaginibacter sp. PAMB04274 TaxID=3138568 RepID=UPI0031F62AEB